MTSSTLNITPSVMSPPAPVDTNAMPVTTGVPPDSSSPAKVNGSLAQGLVPQPKPPSVWIKSRLDQLRAPSPAGSGPTIKTPVPSFPLPITPSAVKSPLSTVFSTGSPIRTVPGSPPITAPLKDTVIPIVNRSLSPDRLAQFSKLDAGQQAVFRGLLSVAIQNLSVPWGTDRIAPQNFDAVVGLILDASKGWVEPSKLPQTGLPPPPGRQTSLPSALPTVPPRIDGASQLPTVPAPATPSAEALPTPAAPTTPTTPTTSTVRYPSTGPADLEPAWWQEAVRVTTDPKIGEKVVQLIEASREFRAQALTINPDVKSTVTGRTPMQEWQTWKAA